jgi:hypothetical protein
MSFTLQKNKISKYNINMSQAAIIGVVVLMMMSSSASAAMLMMGGEDDKKTGPSSPGPSTPPSGPPKGRYVQVIHTVAYDASGYDICEKSRVINLQEIEVYDKSGTKISQGMDVSSGRGFHALDGTGSRFVDGIVGNVENFGHTICDQNQSHNDFVKIDLGTSKEIGKVILYNRGDRDGRINGCKVQILGTDGTTLVKETPTISGARYKHEYDFNATSPSWKITA